MLLWLMAVGFKTTMTQTEGSEMLLCCSKTLWFSFLVLLLKEMRTKGQSNISSYCF